MPAKNKLEKTLRTTTRSSPRGLALFQINNLQFPRVVEGISRSRNNRELRFRRDQFPSMGRNLVCSLAEIALILMNLFLL